MQRFFVEQKLKEGDTVNLPADVARQIYSVLRMKAGDKIILFSDAEAHPPYWDWTAEIESIGKRGCEVRIISKQKNEREPNKKIILFQSVIKKDKLEWVFEKCTEIGVSEFVPVLSERSVKRVLNRARAEKIICEASEQSGRAIIPKLHDITSFKEAINLARAHCQKTFFTHTIFPKGFPKGSPLGTLGIGIFIGPEGGWTNEEVKRASEAGLEEISLGNTILKSETAAVCGSHAFLLE